MYYFIALWALSLVLLNLISKYPGKKSLFDLIVEADYTSDAVFVTILLIVAAPVFLCWGLYDQYILKD